MNVEQTSVCAVKKKKNEALLTHHILSTELKMRTKDTESAMIIQSSGQTFLHILEELAMASYPIDTSATASSSTSSSSSSTLGKRSPAGSNSSSSDKDKGCYDEGPSHRGLSRLRLGLAIRGAGALYTQAILYAASQLLLRTLLDASERGNEGGNEGPRQSGGLGVTARSDDAGNCDAVVDALMHACELPKMTNVIDQHRNRFTEEGGVVAMTGCGSEDAGASAYPIVSTGRESRETDTPSLSSFVATAESVYSLLRGIGMDPQLLQQGQGQGQGSENVYHHHHRHIHQLLLACNALAEAIDVLGLDQVYSMAPLLSGDPPRKV